MAKVDWKRKEDRKRFWHSTSHVLAAAVKELYPKARLAIGPAIEEGFYYDFDVKETFRPEDLAKIEKKMAEIIKRNEKFERGEISKNEALKLFREEPYKADITIDRNGSGETITPR